ncbi:unnamed protein product [Parascedosporium putredinis]|uniref:Telomere length regulation protein conserved domain-containing protein n=1 Tax=Parascedosporium putredinis TaxID=1442378 RepID=A0A9P1H5B9_9PEZI|nr:unnamed protein product [Parascedosporium putredinis]CAI7997773.1 unnamed protein product [Parascedosporium putredinis]
MIAGGPLYTAMVSARLETPNNAARGLGMVVGEAISALIHNPEQRLNFDMSETDSADSRRLKSLTKVNDKLGPVKPLLATKELPKTNPSPVYIKQKPKKPKPTAPPSQKSKLIIEEVGSSDDDITPYDKPDSDDEDSEEDPTLVRRDNVKAPVYIRNLIVYLRDIDSYDKQKIGLKTAPSLIRRKANFGDEVRDHAEELATLFVGLQDKYDMEDFYELRLESMVSLVVALPKSMGPWFIKSFFQGDFSLSQRGVILAALGIATRELGGFQQSAYAAGASFPSKKLTEKMDRLFLGPSSSDQASASGSNLKALPPTALDGIAKSMATSFLGPLAAEAADKATGPDALKLSTLKSKVKRATNNKTGTPNISSKVIAAYILRPLVERYQYAISVKGSRMARILAEPYLLTTYLKTVAVAYHAGGPAMPDLLDLTNLAWDALGPQITDTIEWLNQLLTIVRGGEQEEDDVRLLASGVMVRLHQIVEKYRMNLMGAVY